MACGAAVALVMSLRSSPCSPCSTAARLFAALSASALLAPFRPGGWYSRGTVLAPGPTLRLHHSAVHSSLCPRAAAPAAVAITGRQPRDR